MEVPGSQPQAGAMQSPAAFLWILCVASASGSAQKLVVRLYDYSDLSAKQTLRLTEAADLVFGHSGIHIIWHHCRGVLAVEPEATCGGEMQVNEIAVSLQPSGPRSADEARMGYSIVTAEGGTYARVIVPAVRAQAAECGVAFDILMGYAVAHEVGHCLLGPGHSHAGLMRGTWTRADASDMSRLSLHLTKQEARRAAARLTLAEPAAYQ
jgi:hypothetical protein